MWSINEKTEVMTKSYSIQKIAIKKGKRVMTEVGKIDASSLPIAIKNVRADKKYKKGNYFIVNMAVLGRGAIVKYK